MGGVAVASTGRGTPKSTSISTKRVTVAIHTLILHDVEHRLVLWIIDSLV